MFDRITEAGKAYRTQVVISIATALVSTWLLRLSIWQALTFVIAPLVLVWSVIAVIGWARRWKVKLDDLQTSQIQLLVAIRAIEFRLAHHVMNELIYYAVEDMGWTAETDKSGVRFTSPDGSNTTIATDEIDPYTIAAVLHDTSPQHFSAEWMPLDKTVQLQVSSLGRRVSALEERAKPSSGALATLLKQQVNEQG